MSSAGKNFVPKDELLAALMGMGYTRNQACRALQRTGNTSVEEAVTWILDNPDASSQEVDEDSVDSDEDPTLEGFLDTSDFYKMVLVVNTALDMSSGKMAAQVGHAAVGLYKQLHSEQHKHGEMLLQWDQFGEMKIVLKGESKAHLKDLAAKAASFNLSHYLVQDAGRTQIAAGSVTVLAIMGKNDVVDAITGDLSLL